MAYERKIDELKTYIEELEDSHELKLNRLKSETS